ncbi:MAG: transglutaminase family protein [Deltaproteobacteria bacterium]
MSTSYDITLNITYKFDAPAGVNRTLLRIQPKSSAEQQLISGLTTIDPRPDSRIDGQDFFGNATIEVAHDQPLTAMTFRFSGRVRRNTTSSAFDLSTPMRGLVDDLFACRDISANSPHHFLAASERIVLSPEITAFARDLVRPDMTTLTAVRTVSSALHDAMTFDSKATDVRTPPLVAFRAKRGVCQDFSHIMIAAMRGIGVPTGYVSGFLRTLPPPGRARLAGADAMHAWVRAWCGADHGWVEIDPTNDVMVGDDHVTVAVGRDYADVAPVKGSHWASGGHKTTHKVDVVPV